MNQRVHPSDLELAALLTSKICHDALNPVGSIQNGLELLGEANVGDQHRYALDMIRNVTAQASARLQFARLAFGASQSMGATIDLTTAEKLATDYVQGGNKHKLKWRGPHGFMTKDHVKLLLNLIPAGMAALPRGGEIETVIAGALDAPTFTIRCRGQNARPPQYLTDLVQGIDLPVDAFSIQSYFACRLAEQVQMRLAVTKDGLDVVLSAVPAR